METVKKLTILHNNDMHGEFLPKEIDGKQVGGLALLSGYVEEVRKQKDKPGWARLNSTRFQKA